MDLALAHHLVSDYTSLVAVDVTPARDVSAPLGQWQAPTSAPIGGAWANTTRFSSTATAAPMWLLVGLLALMFAAVLWLWPHATAFADARIRREFLRRRVKA